MAHSAAQRAFAAALAIIDLFRGLSFAARASPPFAAPSLPKATAIGFFFCLEGLDGIAS